MLRTDLVKWLPRIVHAEEPFLTECTDECTDEDTGRSVFKLDRRVSSNVPLAKSVTLINDLDFENFYLESMPLESAELQAIVDCNISVKEYLIIWHIFRWWIFPTPYEGRTEKSARKLDFFEEIHRSIMDVSYDEYLERYPEVDTVYDQTSPQERGKDLIRRLNLDNEDQYVDLNLHAGDLTDMTLSVQPEYVSLMKELLGVYKQCAEGKGKERHGMKDNKVLHFEDQPIMHIQDLTGVAFATGQAIKKISEINNLPTNDRKIFELQGAVVYIIGAILKLRKEEDEKNV